MFCNAMSMTMKLVPSRISMTVLNKASTSASATAGSSVAASLEGVRPTELPRAQAFKA